jgi:cysteine desulfurase
MEPSHVLLAMGYSAPQALGALRLTLGHTTTETEVDLALQAVPAAVERLRAPSAGRVRTEGPSSSRAPSLVGLNGRPVAGRAEVAAGAEGR